MADSAICGQSLMYNETVQLIRMASNPLAAIYDALKEVLRMMRKFAQMLLEGFKALIRAIKEICAAIAKVKLNEDCINLLMPSVLLWGQ